MAKGMLHFTKIGKPYNGSVHKMKDGNIHTGKTHTKSSKRVVHFKDLSPTAKNKAGQQMSVMLSKSKM
jgi:hypothetical protein|tara:strand:+ start:47 stop:250 length:204 start_codon:yes stop_codon:yes gene_type:complete